MQINLTAWQKELVVEFLYTSPRLGFCFVRG